MAVQPSLDDIFAVVDQWFAEEIQRAPLSHDVAVYNQAYAARTSLKNRLSVLITGEPIEVPATAENPEAPASDTAPKSKTKPAA